MVWIEGGGAVARSEGCIVIRASSSTRADDVPLVSLSGRLRDRLRLMGKPN